MDDCYPQVVHGLYSRPIEPVALADFCAARLANRLEDINLREQALVAKLLHVCLDRVAQQHIEISGPGLLKGYS
jgi:hypothetical protein